MKVPAFVMSKNLINPSPDFTNRLMLKVARVNQERRLLFDVLTALLLFSPLVLRELWLRVFYQHDYFAIGSLPWGKLFLPTYGFFTSSLAAYIFLGIGAAAIAFYFLVDRLGARRLNSVLKPVVALFSQVRLRV